MDGIRFTTTAFQMRSDLEGFMDALVENLEGLGVEKCGRIGLKVAYQQVLAVVGETGAAGADADTNRFFYPEVRQVDLRQPAVASDHVHRIAFWRGSGRVELVPEVVDAPEQRVRSPVDENDAPAVLLDYQH